MIRSSRPEDLASIVDVLSHYNFQPLASVEGHVIDDNGGDILSVYNEVSVLDLDDGFVAEYGGKVVGFSHFKRYGEGSVKTTLLSVDPEYRKHGFGKGLQTARMRAAYDQGFRELITFCDNENAVNWYTKHFGYSRIGTESNHHRLHFIGKGGIGIWGIHYGFEGCDEVAVLRSDLERYFREVE